MDLATALVEYRNSRRNYNFDKPDFLLHDKNYAFSFGCFHSIMMQVGGFSELQAVKALQTAYGFRELTDDEDNSKGNIVSHGGSDDDDSSEYEYYETYDTDESVGNPKIMSV